MKICFSQNPESKSQTLPKRNKNIVIFKSIRLLSYFIFYPKIFAMRTRSTLFVLLLISLSGITGLKAQADVNDSLALVDLYNSTNGPAWNSRTNWLTSAPVNTWKGVTVS